SLFLTSCKKELKPQDSSDTPLTETIAAPENATLIVPQEEAVATQVQAPAAVQNVQPATVQPTAPGMNPPHGEPGHRCDIAVGAPLNSPKQTPAAQVAPPKPAATVQQVTPPQPVTET